MVVRDAASHRNTMTRATSCRYAKAQFEIYTQVMVGSCVKREICRIVGDYEVSKSKCSEHNK